MKNLIALISGLLLLASCSKNLESGKEEVSLDVKFRVEEAPEWTALFKRSTGWFGGDGIFAIPFSGKDHGRTPQDSTLFIFSDTMVGEIVDGKLTPGYKMINNSLMILTGDEPVDAKADFRVNADESGAPRTLFVPAVPPAEKGDYFWFGDGFVNHKRGNDMYLFSYRIRNTHTEDDFPFMEAGNSLVVIPRDSEYPYEEHRQLDVPFFNPEEPPSTSFGVGILDNTTEAGAVAPDGFVYVYGIRGANKELVAARIKPEAIEDFSAWEFWDGNAWSGNFKDSTPIADSVSNELSVTPVGDNRYALIYQYAGIFPTIYMQVGPTPVGPFGPRLKVWETTRYLEDKELFSYNAKAHPAISKPGELLVSYNVNSFKFFDVIESMPNLYRPRFVRIIFENK